MEIITSKSNEKIKFIRSLNDKKYRQESKKYYVEGIKIASEILDVYDMATSKDTNSSTYNYNTLYKEVENVIACKELLIKHNGGEELYLKLLETKASVIFTSEDVFKSITDTVSPQGVLIVMKQKVYDLEEVEENSNIDLTEDVLVLDLLQDAGNVGSILRTACSFNIHNIIFIKGSVDVFNPKLLRATMSCIFKVNIILANNASDVINFSKKNGYNLIATSLSANKYLNEVYLNSKNMIVVGNEANGVEEKFIQESNMKVKIPMKKNVESLNVLSATSIILYKNYIDKLK